MIGKRHITLRKKLMVMFFAIGFLWAAPLTLDAQYIIKALPRWMISGHVNYLIPQDPINMFLDEDDWGFQFEAQYRLQYNKPLMAGLYFTESFLSKYVLKYISYSPEGQTDIKEKGTTRRLEFGVTAGFYPEINCLLQPYLQGRVGMAIYQTSSILTDEDSSEQIDRFSESNDSVLSYGIDLGIHIVPNIWYVRGDLRVGFVANPSATFMSYDEESTSTSQYPIDYFDTYTSSGSWFKVSAGVSYLF